MAVETGTFDNFDNFLELGRNITRCKKRVLINEVFSPLDVQRRHAFITMAMTFLRRTQIFKFTVKVRTVEMSLVNCLNFYKK